MAYSQENAVIEARRVRDVLEGVEKTLRDSLDRVGLIEDAIRGPGPKAPGSGPVAVPDEGVVGRCVELDRLANALQERLCNLAVML